MVSNESIFGKMVEVHPKAGDPLSGKFCGKVRVLEWSEDLKLFKIDIGNGDIGYIAPMDVSYIIVSDATTIGSEPCQS